MLVRAYRRVSKPSILKPFDTASLHSASSGRTEEEIPKSGHPEEEPCSGDVSKGRKSNSLRGSIRPNPACAYSAKKCSKRQQPFGKGSGLKANPSKGLRLLPSELPRNESRGSAGRRPDFILSLSKGTMTGEINPFVPSSHEVRVARDTRDTFTSRRFSSTIASGNKTLLL